MPRPLGKIRILMSSRVLLDLEEADRVFRDKGLDEYINYMRGRGAYEKDFDPQYGGRKLEPGPLFAFAVALLDLNKGQKEAPVEVGLVCKDEFESLLPIFRALDLHGLGDVHFRFSTDGQAIDLADHKAFGTDLLLTRNEADAQFAINNGIAAAIINPAPAGTKYEHKSDNPVELWTDGDAVVFGSSAEVRYREAGLDEYRRLEGQDFDKDVEPGPFTAVLAKISEFNSAFPRGKQPFNISLLTARGGTSAARVVTTCEKLGVKFNKRAYFMGGAAKAPVLAETNPDIYFDDQMVHLKESMNHCATGLVPYAEGSPMYLRLKEEEEKKRAEQAGPQGSAPAP